MRRIGQHERKQDMDMFRIFKKTTERTPEPTDWLQELQTGDRQHAQEQIQQKQNKTSTYPARKGVPVRSFFIGIAGEGNLAEYPPRTAPLLLRSDSIDATDPNRPLFFCIDRRGKMCLTG